MSIEDHPMLVPVLAPPEDLRQAARSKGWPDGLLDRAVSLRIPRSDIEHWLGEERLSPDELAWQLDNLSRVFDGALRVREATWRDAHAIADLYANASETVGDWRLVVERSPNPFAQFRLQEHPNMQVIECRGVALAAGAHACHNAMVGGERASVHFMSAWRVRDDFRGHGLSRILQSSAPPATAWFGTITYWYERAGNASQGWLDKMRSMAESRDNKVGGLTATVHLLGPEMASPVDGGSFTVRPARRDDLPRCVELINATHAGLDLFRPYSEEFLESHLDDPSWGPKPGFWEPVFGWDDYFVVEDSSGVVLACGGLWDRGRDLREVWTHVESGDERLLSPTALLDWGYDARRGDAMAALLRSFLSRSAALGRTHLLAPLEHHSDVLDALGPVEVTTETRALRSMGFNDDTIRVEADLRRPYTSLAYW